MVVPTQADARKKFLLALEDEVLDYKHNNPLHIEACATTLIKIFSNILQHPEEPKYRTIKATSNVLNNNILNVKGGEHLLQLAGWRTQVLDLQKMYVFDAEQGSTRFSTLQDVEAVLQKALITIHDKAEKKKAESAAKLNREKEQKEKVLLALEEDMQNRKEKAQWAPISGSAATGPVLIGPGGGVIGGHGMGSSQAEGVGNVERQAAAAAAAARATGEAASEEAAAKSPTSEAAAAAAKAATKHISELEAGAAGSDPDGAT